MITRSLRIIGCSILLLACSITQLHAQETSAHDLVRQVSGEIETLLSDYRAGKLEGDDALTDGVAAILEPAVNFKRIAAGVMGSHRKTASPEQKAAFVEKFKVQLISTYAKGMVGLGEFKINVLEPTANLEGKRRIPVYQEAVTAKGTTKITYTMFLGRKSSDWKLVNVVLDGVNMGKTFATQFDDAMKRNNQDLDATIASWGLDAEEIAAQVDSASAKKDEK